MLSRIKRGGTFPDATIRLAKPFVKPENVKKRENNVTEAMMKKIMADVRAVSMRISSKAFQLNFRL